MKHWKYISPTESGLIPFSLRGTSAEKMQSFGSTKWLVFPPLNHTKLKHALRNFIQILMEKNFSTRFSANFARILLYTPLWSVHTTSRARSHKAGLLPKERSVLIVKANLQRIYDIQQLNDSCDKTHFPTSRKIQRASFRMNVADIIIDINIKIRANCNSFVRL